MFEAIFPENKPVVSGIAAGEVLFSHIGIRTSRCRTDGFPKSLKPGDLRTHLYVLERHRFKKKKHEKKPKSK